MSTLFTYLKQTQRFLRDANQEFLNPEDLTEYINRARRQVAMQAQCMRFLTPISAGLTTIAVTAGGSGYTSTPTVTISVPDSPSGAGTFAAGAQATATANIVGAAVDSIDVTYGGYGYFQPTVTISGGGGTGATATASTSWLNKTVASQEVYPFSGIDLSSAPGYGSILAVKSASFIYAGQRYSVPCYSFSVYQAAIRRYPKQYLFVPGVIAQFGQGVSGSLYAYPIPSTAYQMEWDCLCLPQDLSSDQSVEAVPDPWTDAIPQLAAHYAFLELQNYNAAEYYRKLFVDWMHQYSAGARPGRATNVVGRYIFPFLISTWGALSALVA